MLQRTWRNLTIPLCMLVLCATAACGSGTTIGANPTVAPVMTATPLPTQPAQPTAAPAAQCANVAGFAGAGMPSPGMAFVDIPFPANAVGTTPVLHSTGTGLFTIYLMQICAPGTTATDVKAFYSSQMITQKYVQSATLPFDGGFQDACGDPYCWVTPVIAPRYVGLEKVTDVGNNLVTYQLRLFVPPPYPTCPISNNGNYALFLPQHSTVPLPPLTVIQPGDASGAIVANGMCSAGTANSLDTFMSNELAKLGFKQGPFHPGGGATLNCGNTFSGWISPDNSYAISWNTVNGVSAGNGWLWSLQSCR